VAAVAFVDVVKLKTSTWPPRSAVVVGGTVAAAWIMVVVDCYPPYRYCHLRVVVGVTTTTTTTTVLLVGAAMMILLVQLSRCDDECFVANDDQ
jgi:hypothetical protein